MKSPVCGGFSEERMIDEAALHVFNAHRAQIEQKLQATNFEPETYSEQVVAGMNYLFHGTVNGKKFKVKIFVPLHHLNAQSELLECKYH